MPFGPPVQVSPLIRGTRWALLVAGFFYGISKQSLYNRMERSYQEEEAKRKVIRDKEMAKEKERIAREEKAMFEEEKPCPKKVKPKNCD